MTGSPNPAEPIEKVWESWKEHLARLNEDLTGLEQANECIESLLRALALKRSRFFFSFVAGLFGHWAAIGTRRLYKKGNPRYENVALQRLLDRIVERPDVILKHGDPAFLGPWVGRKPEAAVSLEDVTRAAKRDRDELDSTMKVVADYADTIAHLQLLGDDGSGEPKIKGKDISVALVELRRQVNVYYNLLTGAFPPDLNKERFVDGFEDEVERFLPGSTSNGEPG